MISLICAYVTGALVGASVGVEVGADVGAEVGLAVGALEGAAVGLVGGAQVGNAVELCGKSSSSRSVLFLMQQKAGWASDWKRKSGRKEVREVVRGVVDQPARRLGVFAPPLTLLVQVRGSTPTVRVRSALPVH